MTKTQCILIGSVASFATAYFWWRTYEAGRESEFADRGTVIFHNTPAPTAANFDRL